MIYSLSEKLTAWFVKKDLLRQDDFEVYVYCIDSLLTKLFYYIVILALSICLHMVPQTLLYYIGFSMFRYTAGGYHAKSDISCIVLTGLVYASSMLAISYATHYILFARVCSVGGILFSTFVAVRHAPIDHFNKPVSVERKLQMRKICLTFQIILILAILVLLALNITEYALCIAVGNGIAAAFLLYAYFSHLREE